MNKKQLASLEKLRTEEGFYKLSDLEIWAKKLKLPAVKNPIAPKGDHVAIFKRSHNPSYQVFINIGNKITEITAI